MLKGSSLYMVALIAPNLLSLVLTPLIVRRLSQQQYGALDLLQQISVVASILLGLKITVGLGYFYFRPDADRSKVVGTALSAATLLGAVTGILGWIASDFLSSNFFHSPDYALFLKLIFAGMPAVFLLEGGLGWLRVEDRASLFSLLSIIKLLLTGGGTVFLLLQGFQIGGVVGANLLAAAVVALVVAGVAFRSHGLKIDRGVLVGMLRFAIPSTLSGLALFVIHFLDRFVIPLYWPLETLAIYAIAYKLGMLLNPLQAAFEAYWGAQIYTIIHREDARLIVARTFTYLAILMSFCGMGILFFADPALRILTTPNYYSAIVLVPIILASYYVRALGDFFRYIFLALGLPSREAICNWITAVFALIAYFIFIPRYGAAGAAWSTLATFILSSTLSFAWSYRIWPFRLELARLSKLAAVCGLLVLLHLVAPDPATLGGIATRATLLLAFPALLWTARFATPGELEIIANLRKRLPVQLG